MMELSITARTDARIEAVIAAHRNVRHPIVTLHAGHRFVVNPGVFSPFIAPSGRMGLAYAAQPNFKGKRVLDIGCGSGVIACLMALSGATSVLGIDINAAAVENARKNSSNLTLQGTTEFRVGRLFDAVRPSEEFDLIFADLPFTDGEPADVLEAAFYDPGLLSIRELISLLPRRLEVPGSQAYICLSNFDADEIPRVLKGAGLAYHTFLKMDLRWIDLHLLQVTG